jgi:hypothetical protein
MNLLDDLAVISLWLAVTFLKYQPHTMHGLSVVPTAILIGRFHASHTLFEDQLAGFNGTRAGHGEPFGHGC